MGEDVGGFGECLIGLTEKDRVSVAERGFTDDDFALPEATSATPFVRRFAALAESLPPRGMPVLGALKFLHDAAPTDHFAHLDGDPLDPIKVLTMAALDGAVLDCRQAPPPISLRLLRGAETWTLAEHPLAAWGQALLPALLHNPVDAVGRVTDWEAARWATVPALLCQLLAKANGATDLDPLAVALHDEIRGRAGRRVRPRQASVAGHLRLIVALFVEFGLVTVEDVSARSLGAARITPLGLFTLLLLQAEIDGEVPDAFAEALAEAGYLRCDRGYVRPEDLPFVPSLN
jgi:hypothetical protein